MKTTTEYCPKCGASHDPENKCKGEEFPTPAPPASPDQRTPVERLAKEFFESKYYCKAGCKCIVCRTVEHLCAELDEKDATLTTILTDTTYEGGIQWHLRENHKLTLLSLKAITETHEQRQRAESIERGANEITRSLRDSCDQLKADLATARENLRSCEALYDEAKGERDSYRRERDTAQASEGRLREAATEFRESVLNGRDQLAENGMTSEQTNDVLGLFDDTIGAALAHGKG